MKEMYEKKLFWTFEEICGGVYLCVGKIVCFPHQRLLAITLDGSDSLTGECTLTKVQPHSSQPLPKAPKTARWGENKTVTMTPFFMVIACVHLAKVTSKRVINIAGIIENNEIQYDNS